MYEKWLEEDAAKLKVTKTSIQELQAQIDKVKNSQHAHAQGLDAKEETLAVKESVLQDLHVQLREKNQLMKTMKAKIKALNGTIPEMIKKQPDDDDWAW